MLGRRFVELWKAARRCERSATHLSIGEVVDQYGVSFDQLRYWDSKLGILRPERRGAERIYFREHLELLGAILNWKNEGYPPGDLKGILQYEGLDPRRSVSDTSELAQRLASARRGDVVRVPLSSKADYNTAYVRIERMVKRLDPNKTVGIGKDVEIRLSDDEGSLEARFTK